LSSEGAYVCVPVPEVLGVNRKVSGNLQAVRKFYLAEKIRVYVKEN
jgi:hypothetical protein